MGRSRMHPRESHRVPIVAARVLMGPTDRYSDCRYKAEPPHTQDRALDRVPSRYHSRTSVRQDSRYRDRSRLTIGRVRKPVEVFALVGALEFHTPVKVRPQLLSRVVEFDPSSRLRSDRGHQFDCRKLTKTTHRLRLPFLVLGRINSKNTHCKRPDKASRICIRGFH